MNKKSEYDLCYQCGWLGLCAIACPLADPAKAIRPEHSTHPDIANAADERLEIVLDSQDASKSQPDQPPEPDML